MSSPTFTVSIIRMTRRPPHVVEVRLTRLGGLASMDLWPDLALRILSDPSGSPLKGKPLYDEAWLSAHAGETVGDVSLLSCRGSSATYQIPLRDDSLAALLQKGQEWQTAHFPTRWPCLRDGAWSPDGKSVLLGFDNGVARLTAMTRKGLGSLRALLHHPGLVAVDAADRGFLTAGQDTLRCWDAAGKSLIATHTTPAAVVLARFFDDAVAAALDNGAVVLRGPRELSLVDAGGAAPVAMAVTVDRLAVAFADGTVVEWDITGAILSTQADTLASALGYTPEGELLIGRADGQVLRGKQRIALPSPQALQLYTAVYSEAREEILLSSGGKVCTVSLGGAVQTLAEAGTVYHVQYSPSGRYRVAVGESPDRLYLWDETGRLCSLLTDVPLAPIHRGGNPPEIARFSPSERRVALHRRDASYKEGAVIVLDVGEGGRSLVLPNANRTYAWVEGIAWLDEDRLLVSYANETDKLWTLSTQSAQDLGADSFAAQLIRTQGGIAVCAPRSFSPSHFRLLSPADLSEVGVFPLEGLFGTSYPPTLQISADGQRALLANPFQDIVVVSPGAVEPWVLQGTAHDFTEARLSPSGRWLLVFRKDKRLEWWAVETRSLHSTAVGIDYGRFFFSADEASVICLEGVQVRALSQTGTLRPLLAAPIAEEPVGAIRGVGLLPNGALYASAGAVLYHWRGERMGTARYAGRLVVGPDGTQALVMSERGAVGVMLNLL